MSILAVVGAATALLSVAFVALLIGLVVRGVVLNRRAGVARSAPVAATFAPIPVLPNGLLQSLPDPRSHSRGLAADSGDADRLGLQQVRDRHEGTLAGLRAYTCRLRLYRDLQARAEHYETVNCVIVDRAAAHTFVFITHRRTFDAVVEQDGPPTAFTAGAETLVRREHEHGRDTTVALVGRSFVLYSFANSNPLTQAATVAMAETLLATLQPAH